MGAIDSAINKLRDLIVSGQLAPGDRLLPEPELAAQLGVSRNTLREAVRALIQANVLDVRRGDGTYVTSLEPQLLLSGLSFVIDLMQGSTLVEVAEIRRILEPAATALAAVRIDDATVEKVRAALDRMQAATGTEELIAEDAEFHRLIFQAAGNSTLESLLQALVTQTTKARVWRATSRGGPKAITFVEHRRIVDALSEHDPVLASAAATVLVSASDHWIRHLWEETAADAHGAAEGTSTKPRLAAGSRRPKAKQSPVSAARRRGS